MKSTKMSVRNILGAVPVVLTSPTAGPAFTKAQLREKVHFVNCHGNESDHTFSRRVSQGRLQHGDGRAEARGRRRRHGGGVRMLLRRRALRPVGSAGDEHRQPVPGQGRRRDVVAAPLSPTGPPTTTPTPT